MALKKAIRASLALSVAATIGLSACSDRRADEVPDYSVSDRIKGPDGEYDYVSVDPVGARLFIGREDGVMSLDLRSKAIKQLLVRKNVAAALYMPENGLILTTNSGSDTATLFDPVTGQVKADIATGHEPDGAMYDPGTGTAIVMNGGDNTATFIDVGKARSLAIIALGGKPEAGVSDGKGLAYINIEDTAETVVIDIAKREVIKRYSLGDCFEPTGIAYDAESGLLIAACHNRMAKLVNAATGRIEGSLKIGAGADGSIFDARRRIGAIPCIDGTLTIYSLGKDGAVKTLDVLSTADGARTAGLDPESGAIYLPAGTVERDAQGEYVTARKNFSIVVVRPEQG